MTWLTCIHIDHSNGTALVKSHRTQKGFPVTLTEEVRYLASRGDLLNVIRSPVSREWLAVDYNAMTASAVGDDV